MFFTVPDRGECVMAFEFNFDDEIFQESNCRTKVVSGIYSPKLCDPEWFMRSSPNNDPAEKQNIRKFQGDLLYHKHKYELALVMYQESRQRLPPNNTVLDRELLESMAMCLLKLGKFSEASTLVKETIDNNQHNDSSRWHLLSQIYRAMGNVQGEIDALQHCATLHSWNYQYWYSLALVYEKLSASCVGCSNENFGNDDLGSKSAVLQQCLTYQINCSEKSLNGESLQNTDLTAKLNGCCITNSTNGRTQPFVCSSSDEEHIMNSESVVVGQHGTLPGRVKCKSFSSQSDDQVQGQTKEKLSFNGICLNSKTNNVTSSTFIITQGNCINVGEYHKYEDAMKAPSVQNKIQWRNHILSFGCLIKARFFLEKAVESSSSFAKDKCKAMLTKVNDKISTHTDCGCADLKDKVLEMLYTSFIANEPEVSDLSGQAKTRTEDCKLRENSAPDGEVTFNFEQKWFSNLLSYMLSEKS